MVYCEAIIPEEKLRDNIRQCIKILGGEPYVHGDKISVTVSKNESKMIELFEQLSAHNISIRPS